MKRVALAVVPLLLLAACGSDPGSSAVDPAASTSPTPTVRPTVGTYPAFPHDDYAFTVRVSCYCPVTGPVRITVEDGRATSADWVKPGGHQGMEVPEHWASLTIDQVIEAANDTEAARVDVVWPDGQDWPDSVWVDHEELMADEEIGYAISHVVIG